MVAMIEDEFPLSPVQHGMLFHYLAASDSGVNIEQVVLDFPEALDVSTFRAAWEAELRRVPVLRTACRWKDTPEPMQEVHAGVELEFAVRDWSATPKPESEAAFEAHLLEDRRRGFDLSVAPLMRVALFRLAAEHHRMLWTFHHILIDGRSFVTILEDVDRLYEQIRLSGATEEEPGSIGEYKAFVERLHSQNGAAGGEFWRGKLKGFRAATPLPLDLDGGSRDAVPQYGEQQRGLSRALSDRLRAWAQATGVTLNTAVMGAWAVLLSRYSGETDIVFGATKTSRRGCGAIGLFLTTLPVRVDAGRDRTVREFLTDLRQGWLELREFEDTPLVKIKAASELPPSGALFDSLVVFDKQRISSILAAKGGKWSSRRFRYLGQMNYGLSLLAFGDPEILLRLEYDASRYTQPMIARLLGHLERILEGMAADPAAALGELPMLSDEERDRMLNQWNRTEAAYPRHLPVPDAIAAQAAASPERIAARFGGSAITYAELDRRANQLARYLQRRGIGPGALVGVHVERSIEMLAALLGVLKSGAGYVPLDPGFPADRLGFMAADASLRALITQGEARSELGTDAVRIAIDRDWPAIISESGAGFACRAKPEDLAYVLYTSGSTGKPKGVQITHRALANFQYSMAREPGLGREDVLLAVTTISFDIAALELYLPLMTGATAVLAAKEAILDGQALASLIRAHKVTVMQATPATWQMLLDSGWEGKRDLKALCGGEALSRDLARRLLQNSGELWNMYGPTETTIWSLVRRMTPEDRTILIGRPIANTSVYILDERGNPAPVGVTGELYIGGEGVSSGYLNRPGLTRERFLPDPFRRGGETIYKTGDLARYWSNGEVECLGRNDLQVKIRGFRIELGEVESALREHPAVRQSVVKAWDGQLGARLVGYLIPANGEAPSTSELKDFLSRRLPDYMVPGQFVTVEAFPLTPNGKVNRLALPAPEAASCGLGESYVAPRDALETQLCQAWASVLGREQIGIRDSFFDLGGHSLLAVRLLRRIQEILAGRQVPLAALLQAPTVERFSDWWRKSGTDGFQSVVCIRPGSSARPPLFCVHGAGGNLFSLRALAMALPDDLPFYGLQAKGLDGSEPFYSVEETARCYVDEIRKVQAHGPYYLGGRCYGGVVAFEMARLLEREGEPVALVLLLDTYNFAFGKFLPRHELVLRNGLFLVRRAVTHAGKLAGMRPGRWLDYLGRRLRTARRHVRGAADLALGLSDTQFPSYDQAAGIEGAGELGDSLRRVRRASLVAASKFVPQPYGGRVVVVRAARRRVEPYGDEFLGWRAVVSGRIEAFEIEGDHESIFKEPGVRPTAEQVNLKLLEAMREMA